MKKITVDVYEQEIMIFESKRHFDKWVKKNPVEDQEALCEKMGVCSGLAGLLCTTSNEHAWWFIYLEEKDLSTLSHEALHLAYMILDMVGIEHDINNHEALAYLQGHIFKEAATKLKIPLLFE